MSEDARVELRAYLPEDAAATLAVFRRAIRVTAAGDYTPAQIEAWASDDIDGGDWAARRLASATVVAEGRPITRGVELVNYVMERPAVGNSGSVPGDGSSPAEPDDDSPHRT